MRDNCSRCEGTGWIIDFGKIRTQAMINPNAEDKELDHDQKRNGQNN